MEEITFSVTENLDGKTLKECFALMGFSTTQIKRWKYDGQILVNEVPATVRHLLKQGDKVRLVSENHLKTPSFAPQAAKILFESSCLYAAEKPYGIAVHPDRMHKTDTLGNRLAAYFGDGFSLRIITRLDKTTSGIVLGALDAVTAGKLNKLQARHGIRKTYVAEVEGVLNEPDGSIDLPLLRDDCSNKTVVDDTGKPSLTLWKIAQKRTSTTLLEIVPQTGRTHQIRAHLAAIGHPVVGDVQYGAQPAERIKLHCAKIVFDDPTSGDTVNVFCPIDF